MLKNIDPILTPDLLHALRAMGHGDELVIADANFPATALATRLVRLDGLDGPRVARAILGLLPLDGFVPEPAFRMQVVDDADAEPPVCRIYRELVEAEGHRLGTIERFAFYERTKGAFVIVQTGENRLYGNMILKKGVIRPAQ